MRIGLDIGGTKISAVALDADGAVVASTRCDIPRSYASTLAAVGRIVGELESRTGEASPRIGIALPGVVDTADGTVLAVNLPWLGGRPFVTDLAMVLGRPVKIVNDANALVLSEAMDGAAAGFSVVFGVILGTGVGGGLVVNREIVSGVNGLTGEWGHTPLPWRSEEDGPALTCSCGRVGCLETRLSGSGLSGAYGRAAGREISATEIADRARVGEATAIEVLAGYRRALARALAVVVQFIDPDVIVVGGGLSELPGLIEGVRPLVGEWTLTPARKTRVVKAMHGPDSGVRGAAWLWE